MTAYREIAEKIRQADAVLIGASNGLSDYGRASPVCGQSGF